MNDAIVKELQRTRARLITQEAAVKQSESVLELALTQGMAATTSAARRSLERQKATLEETRRVCAELEQATGALPLKGGGPRK